MKLAKRIVAVVVAVCCCGLLPTEAGFPENLISITISQVANGVKFTGGGSLAYLPSSSTTFTPPDNGYHKLEINNNVPRMYMLAANVEVRRYNVGASGITSSASFACNNLSGTGSTFFKFSPDLDATSPFGMAYVTSGTPKRMQLPSTYGAGDEVFVDELIGGRKLADLGFSGGICFIQYKIGAGVTQRLQFMVETSNSYMAYVVTFYSNIANPSFAVHEQFCLGKSQALCQYNTLCPTGTTFFGDPDCDSTITTKQSMYIVTNSGEQCSDSAVPGATVRWSTNDPIGAPICNKDAARTCPEALTSTTVLACCHLTNSNGHDTWVKVDDMGEPLASAACGGDPHLVRWNGDHLNYHGECDLVLLHVADYRGKPLSVHIRTRGMQIYSFIEAVAIQYGESYYEFNNADYLNPKQYFGGAPIESLPFLDGGFKITSHTMKNFDFQQDILAVYVHFDNSRDKIAIHAMGTLLFVDIDATGNDLNAAGGLLGSFPEGNMLGRDGSDLGFDRDTFGSHWQVQTDEPKLFFSTPDNHPMAPQVCRLPEVDAHEFLRAENAELYQTAVEACITEGMEGLDLDDCVFDVVILRNPGFAAAWWGARQHEAEG